MIYLKDMGLLCLLRKTRNLENTGKWEKNVGHVESFVQKPKKLSLIQSTLSGKKEPYPFI